MVAILTIIADCHSWPPSDLAKRPLPFFFFFFFLSSSPPPAATASSVPSPSSPSAALADAPPANMDTPALRYGGAPNTRRARHNQETRGAADLRHSLHSHPLLPLLLSRALPVHSPRAAIGLVQRILGRTSCSRLRHWGAAPLPRSTPCQCANRRVSLSVARPQPAPCDAVVCICRRSTLRHATRLAWQQPVGEGREPTATDTPSQTVKPGHRAAVPPPATTSARAKNNVTASSQQKAAGSGLRVCGEPTSQQAK